MEDVTWFAVRLTENSPLQVVRQRYLGQYITYLCTPAPAINTLFSLPIVRLIHVIELLYESLFDAPNAFDLDTVGLGVGDNLIRPADFSRVR